MYGGIYENLVEEIIERCRLHSESKFLDVGSGIAQVSKLFKKIKLLNILLWMV